MAATSTVQRTFDPAGSAEDLDGALPIAPFSRFPSGGDVVDRCALGGGIGNSALGAGGDRAAQIDGPGWFDLMAVTFPDANTNLLASGSTAFH